MEKFFKLKERNTTVKTEIIAGITTFMTMIYILTVNPGILSACGMEFSKVFSATAISSAIACLVMGLVANLPFALSAGMGINAFFAYTVCLGMGYSWKFALTAVFVEGIIFILLTLCNLREAIVNSIPENLKKAIGAAIGLFIAFIGLQNAGIVISDSSTVCALNPEWITKPACILTIIGLFITGALVARGTKGALLIGILVTTIIGIPMGVTTYAGGSYLPAAPYFFDFEFGTIFQNGKTIFDFIIVMFTFLFVDMFDTVGTLIGCAGKSGIMNADGTIPNCKEALLADAIGTTAGAIFGTSTVTTFVESASGVAEGGRTGLTAVTVAVLFLLSLFLEPLFGSIPSAATAPALIIVGVMMITPVKSIDFDDFTEGIPSFMCILMMVVTYSISNGIMFGVIFYVVLKTIAGKIKDINVPTWVLFALFVAKIVVNTI
jgi:adenine/guanine/hypoxanthine permease